MADYRYNFDHRDCREGYGASYNQVLDLTDIEPSGGYIEPVTLAEAKNFCKIDVSDDDTLIESLIIAARIMCEDFSNIGFIERQFILEQDNRNGGAYLPMGPIGTISSVTNAEAIDVTYKAAGTTWKQILTPYHERLIITYTGGYDVLPANLKTALLNTIFYLYDNRATGVDNIGPIAQRILKPLARIW